MWHTIESRGLHRPGRRYLARAAARRAGVLALAPSMSFASLAGAQVVPGEGAGIGSLAADRARVRQITGSPTDSGPAAPTPLGLRLVAPTVRVAWNSRLAAGGNDGQLWAGRGANAGVTGGLGYVWRTPGRTIDLVLAPSITYSQNRPFPVVAGRQEARSAFSSPWHLGAASADLPLRFGDLPLRTLGLGQSSLTVSYRDVAVGLSSGNEWWGPAVRNTLLLSDNAPGVPRLFVRTARPVATRIGHLEGRAFLGALSESPFFDTDASNDTRSLSGLLVTFRPAFDSGLTLGLSRLVMAPVQSPWAVVLHPLDVLLRYEPLAPPDDTTDAGRSTQSADQLFSLFARWTFPASGFETYVEWARTELPRSLGEYFDAPYNTQGYTLGLQWANAVTGGRFLRIQGEASYLEQTQHFAGRPPIDYYAGRAAVQGFTQRGQVLGAAIGPGSSSQFVGADWLSPAWQLGAFAGRVRTENDALYREPGPRSSQHDVTLFSGLRGGLRLPRGDVSGELTVGRRYNYLFQSNFYIGQPVVATDIQNVTFTMVLSPR